MTLERTVANAMDLTRAHGITFRRAGVQDAHTIARHRQEMFRDMGYRDEAALDSMRKKFHPWVQARLKSGEYLAWLAVTGDDIVVAGAGLWLMDWPAHMLSSSPRRGNILNVYTEGPYRRRGLARILTESALYWCKANHVDFVILHASEEGRRLYEELGFKAGNEMRRRL